MFHRNIKLFIHSTKLLALNTNYRITTNYFQRFIFLPLACISEITLLSTPGFKENVEAHVRNVDIP